MAARFYVRGTFHLTGRDRFVVYGDVLEGEVRAGMHLQVPLNSQLSFEAPVASVEFVEDTPTGSHVALAFPLDDPLDLTPGKGSTSETKFSKFTTQTRTPSNKALQLTRLRRVPTDRRRALVHSAGLGLGCG